MPAERRERRPSGRAGPRGRRPGVRGEGAREGALGAAPRPSTPAARQARPAVALRPFTPAARQAQGRPALRPGSNYFRGRKGLPPPPSLPLPCPRSAAGGAGSAAGQRAAHRGCRAQGLHSEPTRTLSQSHAAASVYGRVRVPFLSPSPAWDEGLGDRAGKVGGQGGEGGAPPSAFSPAPAMAEHGGVGVGLLAVFTGGETEAQRGPGPPPPPGASPVTSVQSVDGARPPRVLGGAPTPPPVISGPCGEGRGPFVCLLLFAFAACPFADYGQMNSPSVLRFRSLSGGSCVYTKGCALSSR